MSRKATVTWAVATPPGGTCVIPAGRRARILPARVDPTADCRAESAACTAALAPAAR